MGGPFFLHFQDWPSMSHSLLRSSSVSTPTAHTFPPELHRQPEVELCRRGEVRTEKFLQAATIEFLERGYGNARLSDIVARSGGSLATLYRVFGGKKGLALAIMRESLNRFNESMGALLDPDLPIDTALYTVTERIVAESLLPQRIVVYRIVINQGLEFPELRDWFFEHGLAPLQQVLSQYFERAHADGQLRVDIPANAAKQLRKMVFAPIILHAANGILTPNDIPAIQQQARESVKIFLNGILAR